MMLFRHYVNLASILFQCRNPGLSVIEDFECLADHGIRQAGLRTVEACPAILDSWSRARAG
jgi:hypothetical protein